MKTDILGQIGLSKNEIKVYFALLELDQSSATPIVKKSGIPNSKLYPTIDKLIKKGLASYIIKNNVKYFQASDPKNLIELLNNKERQIIQEKQEIEKLIPEMEKKKVKEKQEATIYEGLDGVKVAFNIILNTLKKGEEYYVLTLGEELKSKETVTFFRDYHKKRKQKGIKLKLISNTQLKDFILKYHKYSGMQFKFVKQSLPTGIFIFKDHVMTIVWGDTPTAFIIKSKQNYVYYKQFFEEMWGVAK